MKQVIEFIERLTSRSFIVSVAVIFVIATRPEMSIEQIVGLLVGAGLVSVRAIAEDGMAK